MKNLLIIFVKNPKIGKVKSRLANSIGEEKALSVYKKLLLKTNEVVIDLEFDKCVCYSESIDQEDLWENSIFLKAKQKGENLGVRMRNAFSDAFENSYDKICLIGSDILELTDEIIVRAFDHLDTHDIVLGPSLDGGYYLIGMKSPVSHVFENKKWGTGEVLKATLNDINKMSLKYSLLPILNDIDEIEDINDSNRGYLFS
ncbi:MAG: TIGR04282 family arsenosugar biosynthesis glycosyltransferase [Cyclobacteriaceae bacterium]|nr:TIGR04282 family arsenosugar biosynthesis glycosyltransferase [Cyclobacteriaceae bacterium]